MVQAEFDVGTYDCGICIETKLGEDCFRFGHCGHVFCRVCLKDYFGLLITEGGIFEFRNSSVLSLIYHLPYM